MYLIAPGCHACQSGLSYLSNNIAGTNLISPSGSELVHSCQTLEINYTTSCALLLQQVCMKISCPWRDVYQQLGSEVCLASCCQGYCLQKIIICMHRILVGLPLMQGPVYECPAGCPSLRALHIEHRNNHLILCIHYFRLLAAGVYEAPKPALWVKSVSGPPKSIDEYTDAVALIPASTGLRAWFCCRLQKF